jgi:hypothetical protein
MRWFRLYDDVLNDPKVQSLPPKLFKGLVNIWCLASKHDGVLPCNKSVAFALRMTEEKSKKLLDSLYGLGFLDQMENGLSPHNWGKRQFASDSSTTRTRAYKERERSKEQPGDAPDTESESESESDTDTDKKSDVKTSLSLSIALENYNAAAQSLGLSEAQKLTTHRHKLLSARIREHGLEGWQRAIANLNTPFLLGKNDRGWKANIDFMLRPGNFQKLLENAYAGKDVVLSGTESAKSGFERAFERAYRHDESTGCKGNVVDLSKVRGRGEKVHSAPGNTDSGDGRGEDDFV